MDNKTFKDLLDKGEIGLILSDGGSHLTPQQMSKVKGLSKDLSDERLQRMGAEIASQPGYQDFMSLPLMSKLFKSNSSKDENTTINYEINVSGGQNNNGVSQPSVQQEQTTQTDKTTYQKDPKFTTIGSGMSRELRTNDSESDILAKMFLFHQKRYHWQSGKAKTDKKYRMEVDAQKERFLEETIEAFMGKKSKSKQTKSKGSKLLKYSVFGAGAVGLFLLAEKALANVNWKSIVPDLKFGETPDTDFNIDINGVGGKGIPTEVSDLDKLTFNQLNTKQQDALLDAQALSEGANKPGTIPHDLNNPGAMLFSQWQKEFGGKPSTTKFLGGDKNKPFAEFPTKEKGREAQRELWRKKGDQPIGEALNMWIFGKKKLDEEEEKASAYYKKNVAKAIGVSSEPAQVKRETPTTTTSSVAPPSDLNIQTKQTKIESYGTMTPKAIVMHHTGGSNLQGAISTMESKPASKGGKQHAAQYLIDKDGTIYKLREDTDVTYHAGTSKNAKINNWNAIGVEINAPNSESFTPQQIDSAVKLSKYLSAKYNIPMENVVGHGQIAYEPGGGRNKMVTEGESVIREFRKTAVAQKLEPAKIASEVPKLEKKQSTGAAVISSVNNTTNVIGAPISYQLTQAEPDTQAALMQRQHR